MLTSHLRKSITRLSGAWTTKLPGRPTPKVRKNNVGGYTKLSITRERENDIDMLFFANGREIKYLLGDKKNFYK